MSCFINNILNEIKSLNQNKYDMEILKKLNKEIKKFKVKLKFEYYNKSPFNEKDNEVISIIINYVNMFENYRSKIFILSSLGVEGFYQAIPYIVSIYKSFVSDIYEKPMDEILLLHICDTISKIKSKEHINLYKELLNLPVTPSIVSIINMIDIMKLTELDEDVFNLIEKENKIPNLWVGELNETDKYWVSQTALEYISNKNDKNYYYYLKKFLNPEKLEWIVFSKSKYQKINYIDCYKKYVDIAKKGISRLDV